MSKFFAVFLPKRERKARKINSTEDEGKRFYRKRKFWWIFATILLFVLLVGGVFAYKTGRVLNKISDKDNTVFGSLLGTFGGGGLEDEDGRTNILLLGIRGQNLPGGGLLADSIMVVSLLENEGKVAMISIPRDLYVKMPKESYHTKINAVYARGEDGWRKEGMEDMKAVIGEVTGLKIHYAAVMNFEGFRKLIDAVGGVPVTLSTPFYETTQFVEGNECGGEFTLPQGTSTLNGEQALCYVRARENTSDFDRAKRQQVLLQALKDKLISMGTLTDFSKVNNILDAVGENVRTDMSTREMREFYDKYGKLNDITMHRRVFENSPEGLLMVPQDAPASAGYILIPREGYDNYSAIHEVCRDIFTLPEQSDIDPAKQFVKPRSKEKKTDEKKVNDKKNKTESSIKNKKTANKKTDSNSAK
ncbi:MAG TPA: LCP family protein [Candidatus Moranbacteria bacterium]|nr:LCP family protein [Candidatus Moranbacteria bacterium]